MNKLPNNRTAVWSPANDEKALTAARFLRTSIRPIYRERGRSFELCATALLLRIGGRDLIVSAAHVLDEVPDGNLFIATSDNLRHLGGFCGSSPLPTSQRRSDDFFDFGFLLADRLPALEGCVFLPEEFLLRGARRYPLLTAIGYPSSRNRRDPVAHSIGLTPLLFTNAGVACPETHQGRGFSNRTHVFMPYHRRKLREGAARVMGPPVRGMRGISGGGVWWLGASAAAPPQLAGVIIELSANPPLLIGTRTAVLVTHIEKALATLPA